MSASTPSLVQLSNVRIDRSGRTILRDVSLQVPKGSITAVLGPSGSGKSTLLAALTGELRPVAGDVTLFGKPIPQRTAELAAAALAFFTRTYGREVVGAQYDKIFGLGPAGAVTSDVTPATVAATAIGDAGSVDVPAQRTWPSRPEEAHNR